MKTIICQLRKLLGCPKYLEVPYDWIVSRDGYDLGRLTDPEWVEMFWRKPIFTPISSSQDNTRLFDDAYWADCKYTIRHSTLDLEATHVIIRASGEPPRVCVRGIPERIPEHEWHRKTEDEKI